MTNMTNDFPGVNTVHDASHASSAGFDMNRGWPTTALRWLAREDRQPILVVDSHTAGNPTRIIVGGVALPDHAHTVDAARMWLRDHADWVRRRVVLEPRGGGMTCAVLPILGAGSDQSGSWDIGAVILEPGSYPPMCGHCMIGFAAVICELDLLPNLWSADPTATEFRIRTPAGVVAAQVTRNEDNAFTVAIQNVASMPILSTTFTLRDGRSIPVDVLYGGDYYLSVDAEQLGMRLDRSDARTASTLGQEIREGFQVRGVHDPLTGELLDVYQVMFYRRAAADRPTYNTLVVAPPAQIDRSPCGTGTSALLSHLVASGAHSLGAELTTIGIVDCPFVSTAAPYDGGDRPDAIVPTIRGTAHINGFQTIVADRHDQFKDGFEPV
jgi:proline racemase